MHLLLSEPRTQCLLSEPRTQRLLSEPRTQRLLSEPRTQRSGVSGPPYPAAYFFASLRSKSAWTLATSPM